MRAAGRCRRFCVVGALADREMVTKFRAARGAVVDVDVACASPSSEERRIRGAAVRSIVVRRRSMDLFNGFSCSLKLLEAYCGLFGFVRIEN